MTLVLKSGYSFDPDASTYIDAVETADGEALETGVRVAINDFVLGCKQDEIWDAIKASCILAGARTLNGALVPLVGTAPTNYNFVSGDYDRETGLKGNGSTKYLDSNRAANADPQNSHHVSVYGTGYDLKAYIGSYSGSSIKNCALFHSNSIDEFYFNNRIDASSNQIATISGNAGFLGSSRNSSALTIGRKSGIYATSSSVSTAPSSDSILVFDIANVPGYRTTARLSFYSIGESLDLAKLDTRVSNLITAIGGAI